MIQKVFPSFALDLSDVEPNNDGDQDYLAMSIVQKSGYTDGKWNDWSSDSTAYIICQHMAESHVANSA